MRRAGRAFFAIDLAVAVTLTTLACGTSSPTEPSDAGPDASTLDATPPLDATVDAPHAETSVDAGLEASVTPRGARILALDINSAENNDYLGALTIAQSAGIVATNVSLDWDAIEVPAAPVGDAGMTDGGADAGSGDDGITYYNPYLHVANLVFPPSNISVSLAIRPINSTMNRLPADLVGKRWNDPAVIARFNRVQDYVFDQLPDLAIVTYLIGNEVETFLGADTAAWADYTEFYVATATYARSKRADLKVGIAARFQSLMGPTVTALQTLNATSDVIVVDYLPSNPDFTVHAPSAVEGDIAQLLPLFPLKKPFYFREAGFPSGAGVGSTEAAQADFVHATFQAWDKNADRVPYVGFFTMNEYSQATTDSVAASLGIADPRFKEYLQTLGLRTYADAGADKPAFAALAAEAHARGW